MSDFLCVCVVLLGWPTQGLRESCELAGVSLDCDAMDTQRIGAIIRATRAENGGGEFVRVASTDELQWQVEFL